MSEPARKPDLQEQIGIAVNASVLELNVGYEQHLDRVAALGYARTDLTTVRTGETTRAPVSSERERIAGELAPLLWRAKFGADDVAQRFCTVFYAGWLMTGEHFSEINRAVPGLLMRFSRRALYEWMHEICRGCGGTRLQERVRGGQPIRPRGRGFRNTQMVCCTVCHGSGRVAVEPAARIRALASSDHRVSWREYTDLWRPAFARAQFQLRSLARRAHRPLQSALDRI